MEDGHRPSVEQQKRLNPNMKEVVKMEIIKWLDAGIIFPISDSNWVSLVQCMLEKGGMIVVANEQNVLIPTRMVTGWRVAGHLSRLENQEHVEKGWVIKETFPDEHLFAVTHDPPPWYANYVNFIVSGLLLLEMPPEGRKRFLYDINYYFWYKSFFYSQCADPLMRRCISKKEVE
uniref:Uncharacterized protein n=1 Tax=Nicotiana tabacum TaxID=4097 RepID=A0A1S3YFV6_TOBAC|nr:PREDICTED: uncharacterized protein LOC107775876 [Nicotiana tabacum]